MRKNLPVFIKDYCDKNFNPQYVDSVYDDMIDIMTGNKPGNPFETNLAQKIMKEYEICNE